MNIIPMNITQLNNYTGEDLKPHPYGVLCTAKRQIVTDTAHLKIENDSGGDESPTTVRFKSSKV